MNWHAISGLLKVAAIGAGSGLTLAAIGSAIAVWRGSDMDAQTVLLTLAGGTAAGVVIIALIAWWLLKDFRM